MRQSLLIVDDEPSVLIAMQTALEPLATIITTQDPKQAISLALEHKPSLVLLDIDMPQMNGFEVCEALNRVPELTDLSVIFVTSYSDADTESKGLALGAVDFIAKPLNLNVCQLRVSNHLNLKSQMEQVLTAHQALHAEKEQLKVTLNSIGDAVIATDDSGYITYLNPIAEQMTDWSSSEAKGRFIDEVMVLTDANNTHEVLNPIHVALKEVRRVAMALNVNLTSKSGRIYRVEDSAAPIRDNTGNVFGAIIVFHDISESVAMATRMMHLTHHDQLTGLPNRILLHDRIYQAISGEYQPDYVACLLMIDVDNFKYLNETYGHSDGDRYLMELSDLLERLMPAGATLARVGGDEFVALMSGVISTSKIDMLVNQILEAANKIVTINGNQHKLSTSVGVSLFPKDANNTEALMRHADAAMYRAKALGKNQFCYFSEELQDKLSARMHIEKLLAQSIENNQLVVQFQPKFSLFNQQMTGVESLVRLADKDGSLVPPDQFIPLAEEVGLIKQLGEQVLMHSCQTAKQWLESGMPLQVSVNIAAQQFNDPNLCDIVANILEKTDLPSRYLELEITESALMEDYKTARDMLINLGKMGVSVAIDDFGTGYSSLSYLKFFPLDVLKIDRSFVNDATHDEQAFNIISAIVSLSKSLKLKLVAEGIETEQHLKMLQSLEVELGQGYLFSRPVDEASIVDLYKKH